MKTRNLSEILRAGRARGPGTGGGFTLLELLVVIAVIAILAAIAIYAVTGVMKTAQRKQVKRFMVELEAGLSQYETENGGFPLNPETPVKGEKLTDADAKRGAEVLYRYLSGDFDLDGRIDDDENVKRYVDRLDWWSNSPKDGRTPGLQRSFEAGPGRYVVIDAFSAPIRYLSVSKNFSAEEKQALGLRNPTFDLWSLGGSEPTDEAAWITNWGGD